MSFWRGITRLVGYYAGDASIRWRDDRGKMVTIDPRTPEDTDRAVRLRAILGTEGAAFPSLSESEHRHRKRQEMWAWLKFAGTLAFWVALAAVQVRVIFKIPYFMAIPLAFLLVILLRWIGRRALDQRSRRAIVFSVIPYWLARGHCPACGYSLVELPPQDDRLRMCSECGAAWDVERWRQDFPIAFGLVGPAARRADGPMIRDSRGKRVGLMCGRSEPEIKALIGKALARTLAPSEILVGIAAIAFSLAPLAISLVSMPDAMPMHVILAIIGPGAVLPLILLARRRKAINLLATEVLERDVCPHCDGRLTIEPAADGARVCSECGTAWKQPIGTGPW